MTVTTWVIASNEDAVVTVTNGSRSRLTRLRRMNGYGELNPNVHTLPKKRVGSELIGL